MDWIKINLSATELSQLSQQEKQIKNSSLLKRIQCIKLKDSKWKNIDLSKFFGVCIDTITSWLKTYKQGGLEKLLEWNYQGKPSKLTNEQIEKIKARNKEKPFEKAAEAKEFIEKEYDIKFNLKHVQKFLKKNLNSPSNFQF